MSDKNRVITNGLFRKKMAELLGEDIINTPQFNDFQALDVTTFTKIIDKIINNPPWGSGGGESDFFIVNFTGTSDIGDTISITCDKSIEEIDGATKPVLAFFSLDGSPKMQLTYFEEHVFAFTTVSTEMIAQILIMGVTGESDEWTAQQAMTYLKSSVKVVNFTYEVVDTTQILRSVDDASDIFSAIEDGQVLIARSEFGTGNWSQGFIDLITTSTISVRIYSEDNMYHATGTVVDNRYVITISG